MHIGIWAFAKPEHVNWDRGGYCKWSPICINLFSVIRFEHVIWDWGLIGIPVTEY